MNTRHPTINQKWIDAHLAKDTQLAKTIEDRDRASEVVSTCFGIDSVGDVPPIDAALMLRLRAALEPIDDNLLEACWQRGLLSSILADSLRLSRFLSLTLPLARAVQDMTSVPASYLVADAYFWKEPCDKNSFLARARRLLKSKHHAELFKMAKGTSPSTHAARRSVVTEIIRQHGLYECDRLRPLH